MPIASESADGSEGSWIEMMLAPASASASVVDRPSPPLPPVTMAVLLAREKRSAMEAGLGAVVVILAYGRWTKSESCALKACLGFGEASIATSTGELVHGSCTRVRARNLSIIAGKGCGASNC